MTSARVAAAADVRDASPVAPDESHRGLSRFRFHGMVVPPVAIAACLAAGVIRLVAAAMAPIVRSPDSRYYEMFDLAGNVRPLAATLLFSLLPARAAVIGHALVGSAAIVLLALAVGLTFRRNPAVSTPAILAVLLLGTVRPVMAWDVVVYSESLSISLAALLIAVLLIAVAAAPTARLVVAGASVGVLLLFTREMAILLVGPLTSAILVLFWRRDSSLRRTVAVCGAVVVAAGIATSLAGRSTEGTELPPEAQALTGRESVGSFEANWQGIYYGRILPRPDLLATSRRLSIPSPQPQTIAAWRAEPNTAEIWSEAKVLDWARRDGPIDYAQLLLSHPRYVFEAPFEGPAKASMPAILMPTTGYEGSNLERPPGWQLWPVAVERLFAFGGSIWLLAAAMAAALAIVISTVSTRGARATATAAALGLGVLMLALLNGLFVWHGSPIEYERHGIVLAFVVRVGFILVLGSLLVAVSGRAKAARPDEAAGDETGDDGRSQSSGCASRPSSSSSGRE